MYELKLAEWSARLHVTEGLIGEMDIKIEENSTESDLETIEELLNLPRTTWGLWQEIKPVTSEMKRLHQK
ncbi:complex I assembly factor TIMMDC1, mitochondrial-like [Acipenser oxyrinchus oxyrinchus]|uniref:Complex I assembly factor TIMMDC1, mitochondrial-like n=1 Tax=Acipenser oxyrinchus oxyrinchus TaxID=40147 RepID=A0AAD8G8Y2_ACIOX|nr:complex I assembly factor TIMMDC1, mitochondrial-like [Acipenser oxyrinchus oxyrinchus]